MADDVCTRFRADLHCHSMCSDGSDSPDMLLRKAKEVGLSGLSITDHDTLAAYTPEIFSLAQELGLKLLPGIECSSEWQGQTVHVLGYGRNVFSPDLLALVEKMQERRTRRNRLMVQKLKEKQIDVEEVLSLEGGIASIGRPHIAMAMVQKGCVQTLQEAFEKYLKEGASCYVSECKLTPPETIESLRKAGWKAVLAHPHVIQKQAVLHALLELPWDGLECFYSHLPPYKERAWVRLAKKKGWIPTGGSDYHGKIRPHVPLGCAWVDESIYNELAGNTN